MIWMWFTLITQCIYLFAQLATASRLMTSDTHIARSDADVLTKWNRSLRFLIDIWIPGWPLNWMLSHRVRLCLALCKSGRTWKRRITFAMMMRYRPLISMDRRLNLISLIIRCNFCFFFLPWRLITCRCNDPLHRNRMRNLLKQRSRNEWWPRWNVLYPRETQVRTYSAKFMANRIM